MTHPAADAVDLARLGWDDAWARAAATSPVGRVTRIDRGLASVLTADGPVRVGWSGDLLDAAAADPTVAPVTGDWVLLRDWPDGRTTLETVLPRRTAIVRATPSRRSEDQLLAANATVSAVLVGLVPDPGPAKVERLLAVASGSGALPVLVLTKADRCPDAYELAADLAGQAPGVEVIVSSAVTGQGLDRLRALVGDSGTLALLGSSGSGKSTLVNALVGATVLATRPIRADGRGRHTSVRRELVVLPGGGAVIDTPGLRGVGLAAASPAAAGVADVFADVEEIAARCRFRDCAHTGEPGCAIAAALDAGRLSPRRHEAWLALQRELAWAGARAAARPRRVRRRGGR